AREDALLDSKEDMQPVENFFATQVSAFDRAADFERALRDDREFIARDEAADRALNTIRLICSPPAHGRYDYRRVSELGPLMDTVRAAHDAMLEKERAALEEVVRECMEAIHSHCTAVDDPAVRNVALKADEYFSQRRAEIAQKPTLALLNGMMPPMWAYK